MGVRVLVCTRQGAALVDVTVGEMPRDDTTNLAGMIGILDPMSQREGEYLFTMTLGPCHVDVYFACDRFFFSVIPANSKPCMIAMNAFFAWALSRCFASLVEGRDANEEIPQQLIETFEAMIPPDPLGAVAKVMDGLMVAGVNYVSFIADGPRTIWTIGETKLAPEVFVDVWCAVMDALDADFQGKQWVPVEQFENVAVVQFLPGIKIMVLFGDKAVSSRVEYFVGEVEKAKLKMCDVFQTEDLKPQMPQVPKNGPSARRPGRH